MPSAWDPAPDWSAELAWQKLQVDVLAAKLAQAERAVGQARSATAAADAHRRADALLLELEAAENNLHKLDKSVPVERPRQSPPCAEQGLLFDVG